MVERDKNHPSVIFWDTGNEAGLGRRTARHGRLGQGERADPAALPPVQQPERRRAVRPRQRRALPDPAELEAKARSTGKPIVMGEYAHARATGWATSTSSGRSRGSTRRCRAASSGTGPSRTSASRSMITPRTPPPTAIQAFGVGKPGAGGRRGTRRRWRCPAWTTTSTCFRDRRLDLSGTKLTLDAGSSRGSWASEASRSSPRAGSTRCRCATRAPWMVAARSSGWQSAWTAVAAPCRPAGTAPGTASPGSTTARALRLYIDGGRRRDLARTGTLASGAVRGQHRPQRRDPAGGDWTAGSGTAVVDDVRVYRTGSRSAQLAAGADPAAGAAARAGLRRVRHRRHLSVVGALRVRHRRAGRSDRPPSRRPPSWPGSSLRSESPMPTPALVG